jgi:hypothetical protein
MLNNKIIVYYVEGKKCSYINDIMFVINDVYQLQNMYAPYVLADFVPKSLFYNDFPIIMIQGTQNIIIINISTTYPKEEIHKIVQTMLMGDNFNINENIFKEILTKGAQGGTFKINKWSNSVNENQNTKTMMLGAYNVLKKYFGTSASPPEIRHYVHTMKYDDKENNHICKKNRMMDCDDNFPKKSPLHTMCSVETNLYCNKKFGFTNNDETNIEHFELSPFQKWNRCLTGALIGFFILFFIVYGKYKHQR